MPKPQYKGSVHHYADIHLTNIHDQEKFLLECVTGKQIKGLNRQSVIAFERELIRRAKLN